LPTVQRWFFGLFLFFNAWQSKASSKSKGKKMVVANFTRISSKKLGFLCGLVVTKQLNTFSVCIWSSTGIFGSVSFPTLSAALGFCHFLGVKSSKIQKINQLSLFKG
jgi:hypothetical protein